MGWPTGGDAYGHRVLVVVDGVTPIQGDGNADHRAMQDRSASLCRELRGGTRNAADEHEESEGRRDCGNAFLDLKLAGELCVSETCMQGSGEGSCKSTVWQLGGCLSHCPRAVVFAYVPAIKVWAMVSASFCRSGRWHGLTSEALVQRSIAARLPAARSRCNSPYFLEVRPYTSLIRFHFLEAYGLRCN